MRSRARRWARVVDEATWPEVLRRYLLATRATLPQPSADDLSADPASLDDDVIAVCAAELLAGQPYHRCAQLFSPSGLPVCSLSASNHLRYNLEPGDVTSM